MLRQSGTRSSDRRLPRPRSARRPPARRPRRARRRPHGDHRRDDVGEEHGGVDVVAAHRLERHLGAQLRRLGDLEERVPLAKRAVLGERPARLAHEPHRRALDLLAPQRADEERVGHRPTLARFGCAVPGAHDCPCRPAWRPLARRTSSCPAAGGRARPRDGRGRERRPGDVARHRCSYHWLDERGNAIVWDGVRTPLRARSRRARAPRSSARVRAPMPPGRYRFAVDLVDEHRAWSRSSATSRSRADVDVAPARRRRRARGRSPPCTVRRTPAWQSSALALHAEGFAVVGRRDRGSPPTARARPVGQAAAAGVPGFAHPLLCPSVLAALELELRCRGLPAFRPPADEPWVYDASLVLRMPR